MNILQITIIIVVICAACLFGGLAVYQKTAVYKFSSELMTPADYGLDTFREVELPGDEGYPLRVWVANPAPGKPVIISFYGNFSKLGSSVKRLEPLLKLGFGIAVMEYRGAGENSVPVGELGFAQDARSIYDQLNRAMGEAIDPTNRVIHGFSLGTSIATHLASTRPAAALLLESGFDRLCRFQERRLKGIPMCRLMWAERHDVIDIIPSVKMPILIAHGASDESVPLTWAEALFDAANDPKEFLIYEDGKHTNLLSKGLARDFEVFLQPYLK